MQVSVEKVSNIERRLTITVPVTQIEAAYAKQMDILAKKANIKGFRPGKAPKSFIQQRFGNDARQEAYSEVIQSALYKAITDEKLQPISTPQVEPKVMVIDQPLEFTASFEVLPEIEKITLAMESIEKPVVDVKDADVDLVISQLLKQYTQWKIVDRAAHSKDRVVLDYYAIFDGKSDVENKITNFPLELGSKVMLAGFEDALVGAKAGDEKTLNLHFPADYGVAERAGKAIDFVVNVKQVFEAEVPVLTEDFVQRLGVKTGKETELKEQIKKSLVQERDRIVKDKLKEQVFGQLLEQNVIEVPKALIEREAKNIHDEVYSQHQQHDHHSHSEEELSSFNDVAKKRVSLGLLIAEFAKQSQLKADKDKVTQRIQEIASAYEQPAEVIAWLSSDERRSGIEAQVMEDQVIEKLMDGIKVIDKPMSYSELKGVNL
ncbi:MAG: trigger factor [Gammaproteobacteria bacterium]